MGTGYFQIIFLVFSLLQFVMRINVQANSDYDCDFDSDFCGWSNINDGWQREGYISDSTYTGPSELYDGVYIEMDADRVTQATLQSGDIDTANWPCFIFRYHMKGLDTIGNLTINVVGKSQYFIPGHQGNDWRCGRIYLPDYGPTLKLEIVGYKKGGQDVAIIALDALHFLTTTQEKCSDNLFLTTQECDSIDTEPLPTTRPTTNPTGTTASEATTVTGASSWSDWQTYAIAVPGGVFVLSIIVVVIGVCVRRRKHDDKLYSESDRLQYLENNPRLHYARPSETPSERYPNVFDNISHETYDTINDVYDYIPDGAPDGADADYLQPVGSPPKDKDEGYTILPAITKPQAPNDDDYLHPKHVNLPNKPGKKISISDQGEVCYTDVRENEQRSGGPLRFSGYTDYLDIRH